jgi:hypothetical protein
VCVSVDLCCVVLCCVVLCCVVYMSNDYVGVHMSNDKLTIDLN